jgi:hypothetical protein
MSPDRVLDVTVLPRVDVTAYMAPLRRRDCRVSRAPIEEGHVVRDHKFSLSLICTPAVNFAFTVWWT